MKSSGREVTASLCVSFFSTFQHHSLTGVLSTALLVFVALATPSLV